MLKIKIFPAIKEENLPYFLDEIKKEKLIGCPDEFNSFNFPIKFRDISHKIIDILIVGEEMSAIVEFLDTKMGNHMRVIANGLGEDKLILKESFLNKDNLVLNVFPKTNLIRGVVL